ncbi:MAG: lytic transglycosylase domain-containing protein [Polyangiaceae bacterium]|nr:lytic transglycosylase domain-containing protein [Polyangiaceae bacterium]
MGSRLGLFALAGFVALGCAPATNTSGAPAVNTSSPSDAEAIATATASTEPAPAPPVDALDLATAVQHWESDARLAAVKRELDADKPLAAARAAHEARVAAEAAGAADADRAKLLYFEGVLYAKAGVPDAALDAFKTCANLEGPLKAHALLRATEAAGALGKHDAAVAFAARIDEKAITRARIDAASIESLARAGSVADVKAAATRLFGDPSSRKPGWASLALRVAKALSKKPTAEHARAAIEIADWIRFDSARGRGAGDADKLTDELVSRLPSAEQKLYKTPDTDTLLRRGRRLADIDQSKRALAILDKIAKKREKLDTTQACALSLARGKALGGVKRKGEAYEELAVAAKTCAGDDLAEALMAAGRAAARSHLNDEAMQHFARFEAAFPTHFNADDARLEGARAALDGGDAAKFKSMLASMPDDHPKGDKLGDALFALAIEAMERGAWSEARGPLERGALLFSDSLGTKSELSKERVYLRAGRFTYFLGRTMAELGDARASDKLYTATLVEAPLSYYAALAAARLDEASAGRSTTLLAELLAKGPSSPVAALAASRAKEPQVEAALLLTGLGDPRGVGDALGALGVYDHTAEAATYAFGAKLLAMAGDPQASHALLRTARERDYGTGRFDCDTLAFELPRGEARAVWELAFPRLFSSEVAAASAESNVPQPLVFALMREESSFLPKALSVSDARGLMQLIPPTGRSTARKLGLKYSDALLYDPAANVRIGTRFLAGLRQRFGEARALAIAGYNAGPGAPDSWIEERPAWDLDLWVERIPYTETRNYVKRVWSSYFVYQVLYEGGALGEITTVSSKVPDKRKTG